MKKSIILMLSGLMVFGLAACKEKSADKTAKVCDVEKKDECCDKEAPAAGALIKDYEKFADEYIALVKKAKAGDVAAVQELQKFAQRMQEWATKFAGKVDSFTEEEAKEFQRIAEKMQAELSK